MRILLMHFLAPFDVLLDLAQANTFVPGLKINNGGQLERFSRENVESVISQMQ